MIHIRGCIYVEDLSKYTSYLIIPSTDRRVKIGGGGLLGIYSVKVDHEVLTNTFDTLFCPGCLQSDGAE